MRCIAVVLVLSPQFIRKKHPMAELRKALARQRQQQVDNVEEEQQQQQLLCPVFHSISVEECCSSGFRQLYEQQPWESFDLQEPKPAADVLDAYAQDIAKLCTIAGLRQDQVRVHRVRTFLQQSKEGTQHGGLCKARHCTCRVQPM